MQFQDLHDKYFYQKRVREIMNINQCWRGTAIKIVEAERKERHKFAQEKLQMELEERGKSKKQENQED